jgi:hypothetical protein
VLEAAAEAAVVVARLQVVAAVPAHFHQASWHREAVVQQRVATRAVRVTSRRRREVSAQLVARRPEQALGLL